MSKLTKRIINVVVFSLLSLVVLMCNHDPEEDNYVIQDYEQAQIKS